MNFILIIALLTLFVCIILVLPLWRKSHSNKIDTDEVNATIFKMQVVELEQDLADGKIVSEQFEASLTELKENLGLNLQNKTNKIIKGNQLFATISIVAVVVLISVLLYSKIGSYSQLIAINEAPSVPELIKNLEDKLTENPNNAKGWWVLAQVYQETGAFKKSVAAYRNANQHNPNDSDILTQLAYALTLENQGNFVAESLILLKRAIQIAPLNQDAAYLLGRYYFQKQSFKEALKIWQDLLPKLNPTNAISVKDDIKIAQEKLGITPKIETQKNAKKVTVIVKIASHIQSNPSDIVFVSAHAKNGPKFPLAAVKLTVADLPTTLVLDNTMGVVDGINIDNFESLLVKARISKTGDAITQKGDIYGKVSVLDINKPVEIIINKIQ